MRAAEEKIYLSRGNGPLWLVSSFKPCVAPQNVLLRAVDLNQSQFGSTRFLKYNVGCPNPAICRTAPNLLGDFLRLHPRRERRRAVPRSESPSRSVRSSRLRSKSMPPARARAARWARWARRAARRRHQGSPGPVLLSMASGSSSARSTWPCNHWTPCDRVGAK